MTGGDNNGWGEQAQRGFAAADDTVQAYTALYGLVLQVYGYRCALTGARFAPPVMTLHPDLHVEAIQPRDQGGPLAIANYLPMIGTLLRPFRDGLIAIEDDYRIVVPHPDLLDAELLSALRTTLIQPDQPFRPGLAFIAHHRRYALGR